MIIYHSNHPNRADWAENRDNNFRAAVASAFEAGYNSLTGSNAPSVHA